MRLAPPILILVIHVIKQILFIYFAACRMIRQTPAPMSRKALPGRRAARWKMETNHAHLYASPRHAL